MKKNIILILIATLCLILTACTNDKANTSIEDDTSNKTIQITLPIVSNNGSNKYILTNEDVKNLFTEINMGLSDNFSMDNLTVEVPHGSYNYDGQTYIFNLNEAKVENFIFNDNQHLGLYFHEIHFNYNEDAIDKSVLIESSPDVVLLNHYTGNQKRYNLGDLENNKENIEAFVSQQLNSFRSNELENELIIDEIISMTPSGNTMEVARAGFEYIIENYNYDSSQIDAESYISLQEFVKSEKGICNQFAYLYKLYLDYNGIENRIAYGNFRDTKDYVNHIWNELKINGEWVSVDTTGNGFGSEGAYENYFVSHYSTF